MSGGLEALFAVVCALSVAGWAVGTFTWHLPEAQVLPPPHPTADVTWWFDIQRGTLCWVGERPAYRAFEFIVDLDAVHSTGMTSDFSWTGNVGNYTQHMTWEGRGGSTIGDETGTYGMSLLSETEIYPPWPHLQFALLDGTVSEWFHPFVTKRAPPTDWVLGVQGSDGRRPLPITQPFEISFDRGQSWTEYDPASYTGPTGDCIEDLPPTSTLQAEIDFDPDTLNPVSRGRWVTVYIELPSGYDPQAIDAASIRLNDTLAPVLDPTYGFASDPKGYIADHDGNGVEERMVKFDRASVIALLPPGTYPIRITGRLTDGVNFDGLSDPVRLLGSVGPEQEQIS